LCHRASSSVVLRMVAQQEYQIKSANICQSKNNRDLEQVELSGIQN